MSLGIGFDETWGKLMIDTQKINKMKRKVNNWHYLIMMLTYKIIKFIGKQ